ncbi:putative inactive receptor kinase [Forsythia ovata]|uniref:Inactive receptor kinase n=1 Tax=Forsythia ovata TaxID=205694 RepID=A0ABD1S5U7_9LAMI
MPQDSVSFKLVRIERVKVKSCFCTSLVNSRSQIVESKIFLRSVVLVLHMVFVSLELIVGYHQHSCDPATSAVTAIALDLLGLVGELKFTTLVPLMYLQNLTLFENSLTGRLVPAIGLITSLQVIDLSGNQFYGPIPARLNNLWALHYLNLSNNNFYGWFPPGIRNLQ